MFKQILFSMTRLYTSVEHLCNALLFYSQALLRIAVSFKTGRKMVEYLNCVDFFNLKEDPSQFFARKHHKGLLLLQYINNLEYKVYVILM